MFCIICLLQATVSSGVCRKGKRKETPRQTPAVTTSTTITINPHPLSPTHPLHPTNLPHASQSLAHFHITFLYVMNCTIYALDITFTLLLGSIPLGITKKNLFLVQWDLLKSSIPWRVVFECVSLMDFHPVLRQHSQHAQASLGHGCMHFRCTHFSCDQNL